MMVLRWAGKFEEQRMTTNNGESVRPASLSQAVLRSTAVGALAAAGGWMLYSHLVVDHNMLLPPAIDSDLFFYRDPQAGLLYYYADRQHEGRPLVLVHSINAGASAFEMRPIFERYRHERPVYALDLPGFGFSERTDRAYSPAFYEQAITNFMTNVVGAPADVVALSLGSEFVARAALARPELFRSLVLISPTGLQRNNGRQEERGNEPMLRLLQFPLWSQPFYDLLATRPSIRYFLNKSFVGPTDEGMVDYAYLSSHRPGARHAPLRFVSGMLFTANVLEGVYRHLQQPVLVIYDRDPYTSFEALPDLLLGCANWNAAMVTPTRGLPHFEKLAETGRVMEDFWQKGLLPQIS